MTTLGFVVLAKRPDGYAPVKMRGRDTGVVFTGPNALEQAQNAQEYCQTRQRDLKAYSQLFVEESDLDPVEYVIGEIVPVGICSQCGKSGIHACEDEPT